MSTTKWAIALTALLLTPTQSLLIPPSINPLLSILNSPSSHRPSINFGSSPNPDYHHIHSPHPALRQSPNDPLQQDRLSPPSPSELRSLALDRAHRLLAEVHPHAHYQVTDSFLSSHSGVLHVHFRQVVPLRQEGQVEEYVPVVDGLVNVNVDMETGKVISFGDSFWKGDDVVDCSTAAAVASPLGFGEQGQMVLGTSNSVGCKTTSKPAAQSLLSPLTDPRLSLLSLLERAIDGPAYHESTHDDHLSRMYLSDDLSSPPSISTKVYGPSSTSTSTAVSSSKKYVIHDAPGAHDPVRASLSFVQRAPGASHAGDGMGLDLVWRLEYRSRDNWYEAFVDADANMGGEKPEVRHVVDWVKDWRPTGTEGEEWRPLWMRVVVDGEEEEVKDEVEEVVIKGRTALALVLDIFRDLVGPSRHRNDKDEDEASKPPSHPNPYPAPGTPTNKGPFYRVFPWGTNDPSEGKRELLARPGDRVASPQGWHTIPPRNGGAVETDVEETKRRGWSDRTEEGMKFDDTRSNNVFAQENWEGADAWEMNFRPSGLVKPIEKGKQLNTSELEFDFKLGWGPEKDRKGRQVEPRKYINVSITELFFTCNEIHDLYYRYGFDEQSGNFQEYNGEKGGKGGDAVIANSQDGSGFNNANFATPPDGQRGRMRMYVWNGDLPYRDGDLESGIVIHEYSHGLSTRLTGGPSNSGCLGWGEAGGMGEGWGDFLATMIRMHGADPKDFSMGEWASGSKGGIRKYRYSMNMTTNPETYKYLDKPGYWGVHAIGAVWAEMLYVVGELLISKHGFNPTLFPPAPDASADLLDGFYTTSAKTGKQIPKHGNTLIVQLVLDGMKLQPCRPNFMNARDAILQADQVLTGGENSCEIWRGFAMRGLGPEAALKGSTPWGGGVRTEDYGVPAKCGKGGEKL